MKQFELGCHQTVRIRILTILLALLLALGTTSLMAQTTTSTLEGQVVDQGGNIIPGASLIVTNTQTGLARTVESDGSGHFVVRGLQPSTYHVEAQAEGFYAAPVETVLNVGRTTSLEVQMSLEEVDVLVVTADRPTLNTTESEVSTVVELDQIEQLPLINRDFTDLASLAPGAKPKQTGQVDPTKNDDLYRPFTIGAGNGRAVNIQIDGGDNNDRAVGTWTQGYSAEAIQEFEIITDQYRAEYGRAAHGVVNVITKSGSNQLKGSLFGLYRDDSFRSRNFSERLSGADKAESERNQYGGSLGGPVLKDNVFFFLAYERVEEDSPTAYSPSVTGFARTAPFAGQTFTTGLERDLLSTKVNWNVSDGNTVFLRYALDENSFLNDQGGALTLDVFNGNSTNEGYSLLGNWSSVVGNFLNEATVHVNHFENGIVSNTPIDSALTPGAGSADFDFITIQGYDLFSLGRNGNTPQATIQSLEQFKNDATWIAGDHELKVGFDVINAEFDDSLLGSLEPTITFGFQTGVTPDTVDANGDSLGIINAVGFNNPGFIPGTDYTQLGLYVQDTWRLGNRWTLFGGLRYDKDDGVFESLRQGINRTFYEAVAAGAPDRFGGAVFPEDPEEIAPRLGFVYQLGDSDKNVLRGSYGIFYDKVIENLTIFGTQNLSPVVFPNLPGLDCTTGGCVAGSDPDGPGGVDPIPVDFTWNNWLAQGALRNWYDGLVSILGPLNTLNGQAFFVPAPNWQLPSTRSLSLGWGHRFNNNWSVDTNAIYSKGYDQLSIWDVRGRNSGVSPASAAGREFFLTTDGISEYKALHTQVRGRTKNLDLTFNLTLSEAEGSQDLGASAIESGTLDIFSGGNRRYTGPDPSVNPLCNTPGGPICNSRDDEFGTISGDQTVWASLFASYRLPWGFALSGNVSYGSEIAFRPWAGFDANNDGFVSGSEYVGEPGGGEGDDFFNIDLRLTKVFHVGDLQFDIFGEVFNLTNQTNYGLFVDQRQFDAPGVPNANFGTPTGNEVGQSRTYNAGFRFRF